MASYFENNSRRKAILSKLVRTLDKFQMFDLIWFQTMWERELGSETDNIFTLERKQVKNGNKSVYRCKTLGLCVTSKKYHSFN